MKYQSLTWRLIAFLVVWAIFLTVILSHVLSQSFRQSAEQSFDETLNIALKILVGEVAVQESGRPLVAPTNLGEARFELPLSGWYWTVSDRKSGKVLLASESLVGGAMKFPNSNSDQDKQTVRRSGYGTGPDQGALRILERIIRFQDQPALIVRVSGNATELNNQVDNFRNKTRLLLISLALFSLVAIYFTIRIALRPLDRLQEQLRLIRAGDASNIEGNYPTEVAGLVAESNELIESNRELIERARTQVGNLAHGLKTPLSVMTNEVRDIEGPVGDRLRQQILAVRDQVQLYLERARVAAQHSVIGASTPLEPVMSRLTNVMTKIHGARGIDICLECPSDILFRGEEHDLEEIIGNILDNGCKWAESRISIKVKSGRSDANQIHEQDKPSTRKWLTITVEDDGPGMTASQMQEAKRRGHRFDETKPGSGLGLSIVEEIVALYKGSCELSRSEDKGLKVVLILPAV